MKSVSSLIVKGARQIAKTKSVMAFVKAKPSYGITQTRLLLLRKVTLCSGRSCLLLTDILIEDLVIAFGFYQIDFITSSHDEVRMICCHQPILSHIIDDGERMLAFIDLQEALYFPVSIQEVNKRFLEFTC